MLGIFNETHIMKEEGKKCSIGDMKGQFLSLELLWQMHIHDAETESEWRALQTAEAEGSIKSITFPYKSFFPFSGSLSVCLSRAANTVLMKS